MARLFVEQLTVLDFSYLHPSRGLLGESWRVDVELGGMLDGQGMVLDFGVVKKRLKRLIDDHFDHRLLVPLRHPGLAIGTGPAPRLRFATGTGQIIEHLGPRQAIAGLDARTISPEGVAAAIVERFRDELPKNVRDIELRLYPEPGEGPFYRYSHGLKGHDGNCQRIAHGHRSTIRIHRNGQRDQELERLWAERWRDVYIGSREDLRSAEDAPCLRFAYQAAQGEFSLSLPASRCYLIDTESTVENLAAHIARRLGEAWPDDHFTVRAFEGIGKGAIAESG